MAPSAKRHPLFAEAKCQVAVLYLGQTLATWTRTFRAKVLIVIRKDLMTTCPKWSQVIPAGWWWYSVSLDPSVTQGHQDLCLCDHVQQTCTRGDVLSVGTVTSWLPVVQSGCGISSGQMRTSSDSQKLHGSTSTTSSSAI